jgi:hypothetical protein
MDREEYEKAKERLGEVTRRLKYDDISTEERERLEKEGRELMSFIMSPLIPFGWGYRILMLVIVFFGIYGVSEGNYPLLLIWLVLPFFSPRIIGKVLKRTAGFRD